MAEILRGYDELAALLLDKSEAELVQGGVRLRETLDHLKRVEVALQESESRHAFLLRLGDALRLLSRSAGDSGGGQPASRRAAADRPGLLRRHRRSAGLPTGRTKLSSPRRLEQRRSICTVRVQMGCSDFRVGGPVVVADTLTSPLIPEADRPAVVALGVGAFVGAPLIRDGRLVAALFVSDCAPGSGRQRKLNWSGKPRSEPGRPSNARAPRNSCGKPTSGKTSSWRRWRTSCANPLAPISSRLKSCVALEGLEMSDQERLDLSPVSTTRWMCCSDRWARWSAWSKTCSTQVVSAAARSTCAASGWSCHRSCTRPWTRFARSPNGAGRS